MRDHTCFDHRTRRPLSEGDDVLVEVCTRCGKVRHESFSHRPMAWFTDTSNPAGHRYAYSDPQNDPFADEDTDAQWRHPHPTTPTRGSDE